MKPIRESLAQSVSKTIIDVIKDGRWESTLPSIRVLCEEMEVSRQTMLNALRIVEQAGYVMPAIGKRLRKINTDCLPSSQEKSKPRRITRKVSVIAWQPEAILSEVDFLVCTELRKLITSHGFEHQHLVYNKITNQTGATKIISFIRQNPADVYIVIGASPACAKVLKKAKTPVVYVGGEEVDGCFPRVSFSMAKICSIAIKHLVSIGHHRISVMIPESLNRRAKIATRTEAYIRDIFESYELPFSTYNCPRWGRSKQDYMEALEKLFALTPPTALVLGDSNQVPRVMSYLLRNGLRYPEDLSIIVLDESSDHAEYEPPISDVKQSVSSLAKLTVSEVLKMFSSPNKLSRELITGKSHLRCTGSISDISKS